LKFLIKQPVTDHVLDVISHHRQHRADKVEAKISMAERREGHLFTRARRCACLRVAGSHSFLRLSEDQSATVTNLGKLRKPVQEAAIDLEITAQTARPLVH
jgi:hypothetical protein